jgi:hypothetical protein
MDQVLNDARRLAGIGTFFIIIGWVAVIYALIAGLFWLIDLASRPNFNIFEAFAQGEAVDSRVHAEGGVGLGLYIVRTLSEQLGASVRAERRAPRSSNADSSSNAEGGSRFVITLRACRARVPQAV